MKKIKTARKVLPRNLSKKLNLDFDAPEVQTRMFSAGSELARQMGLPIMSDFLRYQAGLAERKAGAEQDAKQLVQLEHLPPESRHGESQC